jgi:hypothetical protein
MKKHNNHKDGVSQTQTNVLSSEAKGWAVSVCMCRTGLSQGDIGMRPGESGHVFSSNKPYSRWKWTLAWGHPTPKAQWAQCPSQRPTLSRVMVASSSQSAKCFSYVLSPSLCPRTSITKVLFLVYTLTSSLSPCPRRQHNKESSDTGFEVRQNWQKSKLCYPPLCGLGKKYQTSPNLAFLCRKICTCTIGSV